MMLIISPLLSFLRDWKDGEELKWVQGDQVESLAVVVKVRNDNRIEDGGGKEEIFRYLEEEENNIRKEQFLFFSL